MILSCPECSKRYIVAPGVFGAEARQVRCANCGHVWQADPPDEDHEIAPTTHIEDPEDQNASVQATPSAGEESPDETGMADEPDPAPASESGTESPSGMSGKPEGTDESEERKEDRDGEIDSDMAAGLGIGSTGDGGEGRHDELRTNLPALRSDRSRLIRLGWWALVMFWLIVLGGGLVFQASLTERWPVLGNVYAMVGLEKSDEEAGSAEPQQEEAAPVLRDNLEINQAAEPRQQGDGTVNLFITVELANTGAEGLPLPPLEARILDAAGEVIASYRIAPPQATLAGGGDISFAYTAEDIPAASATLEISADWQDDSG